MTVLTHDAGFALARCGNAFVNVWSAPATLDRLQRTREHEQRIVDGAPGGIVVLSILVDSAFQIGASERDEASQLARQFETATRAHAYVIEGSGFRTAAMRAVIAGIQLVTRTRHPSKVFGDIAAAAAWLAPQAEPPLRPQELIDTVARARAAIR
jgi:hypothetical protein